ncbi:hypothetical protein AAFF_G00016640 [Aldrovandia affinis]|uniref:Uncharacterized protein n=1 Tax=Aldrovandia affinis TaxID=143900 RepID=A0AAD7WH47_9TELE|nr:hypothetical protein AAFF_G00016640 [Aldrovandia affinis]
METASPVLPNAHPQSFRSRGKSPWPAASRRRLGMPGASTASTQTPPRHKAAQRGRRGGERNVSYVAEGFLRAHSGWLPPLRHTEAPAVLKTAGGGSVTTISEQVLGEQARRAGDGI